MMFCDGLSFIRAELLMMLYLVYTAVVQERSAEQAQTASQLRLLPHLLPQLA